jgi:hypothetical protein
MAYHKAFFGVGNISAIPSGANPTPVPIATVKGVTVEFKATDVPLPGQYMVAQDRATTSIEITGTIQSADFSADMVSLVLPNTTTTTGTILPATHVAAIPTTPFTITVTNSATFDSEMSVVDLTAGKKLKRVESAPATGEYSVAAGVFTFAAADTGHNVSIAYLYASAATGKTINATNQLAGTTTTYILKAANSAVGKSNVIKLPAVSFNSLSLAFKNGDWSESNLGFSARADDSGNLFYGYLPE